MMIYSHWITIISIFSCIYTHCFAHLTTVSKQEGAFHAPSQHYVVLNPKSRVIMLEKHSYDQVAPASLTKLMSLVVAFDALKAKTIRLDDDAHVSKNAWSQPGSRMFIEPGSYVPVKELLLGIAVVSGNDASVALAEHVAENEHNFVKAMNQRAQELGMRDTHFENASGLPHPKHVTTAYDLGLLASEIYTSYPELMALLDHKTFTFNKITQRNRNALLWKDKKINGMKTGHTDSAGFCVVASTEFDGNPLIAISLGSKTEKARDRAATALFNYAEHYYTHHYVGENVHVPSLRVRYGSPAYITPTLREPRYVTHANKESSLHFSVDMMSEVQAPLKKGSIVGYYTAYQDKEAVTKIPIVVSEDVPSSNMLYRFIDWISLQCHVLYQYLMQSISINVL